MAVQPFLAEVVLYSFNFPPRGWAFCNGQLLAISTNTALFSLLGTNFGGDGRVNFGLPDLRGRTPVHTGSSYAVGQSGGAESATLGTTTTQVGSAASGATTYVGFRPSQSVATMMPFLAPNFSIALQGVFPSRN